MDLDSQSKPKSEFMSLTTQAIAVFYSMDLNSQPKSLQEIISFIAKEIFPIVSSRPYDLYPSLRIHVKRICNLEPKPELVSLIYEIFSLVISIKFKSCKLLSLCPQVKVIHESGIFQGQEVPTASESTYDGKWDCVPGHWMTKTFPGEDATYFWCRGCNGRNHEECEQAPVEIIHHLHPKHCLRFVFTDYYRTRDCYCCDKDLEKAFFCCLPCNFAINMDCTKEPPILHINHPKWHEHTLALFPRDASLTCNLCALADASSPIYMCPPCDFVVHLRCINLPRVIKISRHHHRISFTPSFYNGELSCGVCRRKINNDYGGYSCIKKGCSYVVHSRCATQANIWDGEELEGELEEDIEQLESFVRISDGIIRHASHQHHHLKLDDNTNRDYDENKECEACIMPVYFGNFYSCIQCHFILHEECANLSCKIDHPIHPHMLTLKYDIVEGRSLGCTACTSSFVDGFFYECNEEECFFKLHVQCATISEPLVHESHQHKLFLTSKPGEKSRFCSVCKWSPYMTNDTFNCIEECDFALCFGCATIPHKVKYKHDKHVLTLSYGKETGTMTYWCEVCEEKIDPTKRFYVCDEYCCVMIHVECLLGQDLYMKVGSSWDIIMSDVEVLPNNRHMTRPICFNCGKRCPQKIVFEVSGSMFCSAACFAD